MGKKTSADGSDVVASADASVTSKYTGKTLVELKGMSEEERNAIMDALAVDKQLALAREVRDLVEKYLVECELFRDRGIAMYNGALALMDRADQKVFDVLRKMQKQEDEACEREGETDGDE